MQKSGVLEVLKKHADDNASQVYLQDGHARVPVDGVGRARPSTLARMRSETDSLHVWVEGNFEEILETLVLETEL
jgi:hypothetical protein